MASNEAEAARAARKGADLNRPLTGENPESASFDEARHWYETYAQLVELEEALLDRLAELIPKMPASAQREAEETNLPVLLSQLERFRHRLQYWTMRKRELESR